MKYKIKFTTTQLILLSFLIAIVTGSLLLMLPISSATGQSVGYVDALFTATTAVCVTGLVTLPTVSSWSFFGQFILLILIQIGGLGIITIMSGLMISLHKKMGMKERILIQDAFNLNTMSGMIRFIKKVLLGTFIVEGIGAVLYMLVFVPEFGLRGVWIHNIPRCIKSGYFTAIQRYADFDKVCIVGYPIIIIRKIDSTYSVCG